jgi:hypothetical protein
MTSTNSKTHPWTTRRTARSIALGLTSAVAATITSAALGLAPRAAEADPGDTFVPIGSSQLVQSEDLSAIQVTLDTETVVLNRDDDFSSCLGEGNPWTAVLRGSPKPITSVWRSQRHDDRSLSESIAQAATPAQAKRYARTLLDEAVGLCQGEKRRFDFHYGPNHSDRVGSGFATWALSYPGNQRRPDGGVVVFRKGTNFGIIHVNGTWGPADQTIESVAKVAVNRLADQ